MAKTREDIELLKRQWKHDQSWDKRHDFLASKICPMKLMQFTGLKDRYDYEIYEGDIVSYAGLDCQVIWSGRIASFRLKRSGKQQIPQETQLSTNIQSQLKIIGNIYENPGLGADRE